MTADSHATVWSAALAGPRGSCRLTCWPHLTQPVRQRMKEVDMRGWREKSGHGKAHRWVLQILQHNMICEESCWEEEQDKKKWMFGMEVRKGLYLWLLWVTSCQAAAFYGVKPSNLQQTSDWSSSINHGQLESAYGLPVIPSSWRHTPEHRSALWSHVAHMRETGLNMTAFGRPV